MKIRARILEERYLVIFHARTRESGFRTAARKLGFGTRLGIAPTRVGTDQWQCDLMRKGHVIGRIMVIATGKG